jgi:hypothetical protein
MMALSTSPSPTGTHPKVEAALRFVGMIHEKDRGTKLFDAGAPVPGEVTSEERATSRAALELLRNYFAGEITLEDQSTSGQSPGGDDGDQRVPATV